MVLEGIIQTSKGAKQPTVLPSYDAYEQSNDQHSTVTPMVE